MHMQVNELLHPRDASRAQAPTLFEAAIQCAVLSDFGPLYQELEAMAADRSNGDHLITLLREMSNKALEEIERCPYPQHREMIGNCYLNEIRFLAREYDAIGRKTYGPQPPIGFLLLNIYPADGGTEHELNG
jgi:hypothetical protein